MSLFFKYGTDLWYEDFQGIKTYIGSIESIPELRSEEVIQAIDCDIVTGVQSMCEDMRRSMRRIKNFHSGVEPLNLLDSLLEELKSGEYDPKELNRWVDSYDREEERSLEISEEVEERWNDLTEGCEEMISELECTLGFTSN